MQPVDSLGLGRVEILVLAMVGVVDAILKVLPSLIAGILSASIFRHGRNRSSLGRCRNRGPRGVPREQVANVDGIVQFLSTWMA